MAGPKKSQTNSVIPPDLSGALANLAEAIVPLADWMKGDHAKFMPQEPNLPWRPPTTDPPALATVQLMVVEYLDDYLRAISADEEKLVRRLRSVQHAPPQDLFPARWRRKRELAPQSRFGVAESENVPVVEIDEDTDEHHPTSRREFYGRCWPFLRDAVSAFGLGNASKPGEWTAFVKLVHKGDFGPQLAEFIRVFAIDVIHALMNQDSPRLQSPWRSAVLIELGEGRRPEKQYTVAEVNAAVATLESVIPAP